MYSTTRPLMLLHPGLVWPLASLKHLLACYAPVALGSRRSVSWTSIGPSQIFADSISRLSRTGLSTPCGTRTRNLRIRSPTPCPLGQGGHVCCAFASMSVVRRWVWWVQSAAVVAWACHVITECSQQMTRPGLEPGISGSGGRRLIH